MFIAIYIAFMSGLCLGLWLATPAKTKMPKGYAGMRPCDYSENIGGSGVAPSAPAPDSFAPVKFPKLTAGTPMIVGGALSRKDLDAFIRASDERVSHWSAAQQEAFREATACMGAK